MSSDKEKLAFLKSSKDESFLKLVVTAKEVAEKVPVEEDDLDMYEKRLIQLLIAKLEKEGF
jgi:hypothetical protein